MGRAILTRIYNACLVQPLYYCCNWRVERANGSSRYEFYPFNKCILTVAAVNQALVHYQWIYNHYRPHDSLDLMAPMAYSQQFVKAALVCLTCAEHGQMIVKSFIT